MTEQEIIKIIEKHQSITYPNGIGSIYRCLDSRKYKDVAKGILKLINTNKNETNK